MFTSALRVVVLAGCASLVACGTSPSEPTAPPLEGSSARLIEEGGTAGYVHTISHSRFAIGGNASPRSEFGMQKMVGTDGVFATRPLTSLVVAMPNATAPCRKRPPLAGGPDAHNRAVQDYFVKAGLPADQILKVETYSAMSAGGAGAELDSASLNGTLNHYFSVVTRQVNGIAVLDSFAWARINADGDVVSESVYWPPLSASVSTDAAALQHVVTDPATRPGFLAKISTDHPSDSGQIFIRHTPGEWDGSFVAAASYDIGDRTRILHVRADGSQFTLPHEAAKPLPPPPPKTK